MKNAPVILTVMAMGAAFGWMMPTPGDDGAPARQTDSSAAAVNQQWLAGEVSLDRAADGHFYADASVDGTTISMLVDTGASVVALTGEDAAALGLSWDDSEMQLVGHGAGGPVMGIPVTLDRVAVGDIEVAGVDAVILPEGLGISLLGQSFLNRAGKMDVQGEVMVLGG